MFTTFEAKKNTFYRLKNDPWINWRVLVSKCNKQLFKQLENRGTSDDKARCLIIDETDFEKKTYKTEHVGKIWSHVRHPRFFGFKGLFLGYWDGKSFFSLDFSLHKEKGKDKKKPYGLKAKQRKKQYSKQRDKSSSGKKREGELLIDKISVAISMIKKAVKQGIKVDYMLMDSWFFCEKFLQLAASINTDIVPWER